MTLQEVLAVHYQAKRPKWSSLPSDQRWFIVSRCTSLQSLDLGDLFATDWEPLLPEKFAEVGFVTADKI